MAWNNHHFFTTLSPAPPPMSTNLERRLSAAFSSIDSMREQYLATALSMFGPGFVWLIRNPASRAYMVPSSSESSNPANDPEYTLLCTYIAGSPIADAHPRAQTMDMNTENALTAGRAGPYSGSLDSKIAEGRMVRSEICLGVNTWEHCWLHDFGVGREAKRAYLEAWWDSVDWDAVERNSALNTGNERSKLRLPTVLNRAGRY